MQIHHICIQTNCYKNSKEFYINVLGFKLVKETKNFHQRDYNTFLELNGFFIELQTGKKTQPLIEFNSNSEGITHFALMTEDIDKTLDLIREKGYNKFKCSDNNIIYNVEGGKLFKIIAPEGTIIEIKDKTGI